MDIVIDFDGTCVTHEFPEVGKSIGAEIVLKRLVENGHKLFLNTMRSDITEEIIMENLWPTNTVKRNYLQEAIDWFKNNGIELSGANEQNPEAKKWTVSSKIYGQLYIDDASLGCPLLYKENISERPFVDWFTVERLLSEQGFFHY